jgi:hypothetical protein
VIRLRQHLQRLISVATASSAASHAALFFTATMLLSKDWRTRLGLSLTHQGRNHFIQYHHVFPKALLKPAGYNTSEINEIANMAFITGGTNRKIAAKPPADYLAELIDTQGPESLSAHCIPLDPAL